jgi:ubiquinone/menaquinone biosynthesis C-methylase UbiE
MTRVDYDGSLNCVYHAGRRHPEVTTEQWRGLLLAHSGTPTPRRWLDVGAGTGRFSVLLADWCDAHVVGVEPSAGMRAEASTHAAHPRVEYRAGAAEAIDAPDASFDAALMSMVYHHLQDAGRALREVRRVLRPRARLLLRNDFAERHLESTFYEHFDAARRIDGARLPRLADVHTLAREAGFVERHHEVVRQITDESLERFEARMRTRPSSTFELMSEVEIERGFARVAAAIAADPTRPAIEHVDLLVLEAV